MKQERRIPQTITYQWLKDHDACGFGLAWFKKKYPKGLKVTKAVIKTMLNNSKTRGFLDWFLEDALCDDDEQLFSYSECDEFDRELKDLFTGFELDFDLLFDPVKVTRVLDYYRNDVVELYWRYFNMPRPEVLVCKSCARPLD